MKNFSVHKANSIKKVYLKPKVARLYHSNSPNKARQQAIQSSSQSNNITIDMRIPVNSEPPSNQTSATHKRDFQSVTSKPQKSDSNQ